MATHLPKTPAQLRRMLGIRLAVAAIVMGGLAGGVAYFAATYRAERTALQHAESAASHFVSPAKQMLVPGGQNAHEHLKRLLDANHFVAIRLFDGRGNLAYEIWEDKPPPGAAHALQSHQHKWPAPGQSHLNWLRSADERLVQVVLPIGDRNQIGFLEGIYRIDLQSWQMQRQQVQEVAVTAVVAVVAATVLLYPLLLAMLRNSEGLARRLLDANLSLIRSLGNAVAKRDSDTDAHNYRVTLYAVALGEALKVKPREIADLVAGAFLHDVGKIGIPDQILLKPGKLDEAEFLIMKTHAGLGVDIVGDNGWLAGAGKVIRHHHERYDGGGYPDGLAGETIPRNARIFAVVDVFDALTSARPYKSPLPLDEALFIILQRAGGHFDTQVATTFVAIAPELHARIARASAVELHQDLSKVLSRYFKSDIDELTFPPSRAEAAGAEA